MAMVRLEQIGERIGEIDALPGPEAKESCAALEKEISEALRVASGRERTVLETLRHKLAVSALASQHSVGPSSSPPQTLSNLHFTLQLPQAAVPSGFAFSGPIIA